MEIHRNTQKRLSMKSRSIYVNSEVDAVLSTDDLISIVIFILVKSYTCRSLIRHRSLSSSLPAHFVIIDAFSPCELSCSVLGFAYGIMETAMMWILKAAGTRSHYSCLQQTQSKSISEIQSLHTHLLKILSDSESDQRHLVQALHLPLCSLFLSV